jgi:hypothetical protein
MTHDQFRAALADLGLTQAGFARLAMVDARTVRRWCDGTRAVPGPVVALLGTLKWQPIETAPRDGSKVILGHPDHEAVMGVWREGHSFEKLFPDGKPVFHWAMNDEDSVGFNFEPKDWMPLPSPPKTRLTTL